MWASYGLCLDHQHTSLLANTPFSVKRLKKKKKKDGSHLLRRVDVSANGGEMDVFAVIDDAVKKAESKDNDFTAPLTFHMSHLLTDVIG